MLIILNILIVISSFLIPIGIILKMLKGRASFIEILLIIIYIINSIFFKFSLFGTHNFEYSSTIVYGGRDGTGCYSPFGEEHTLTLNLFLCIFYISILIVWAFKRMLSPILLTLSLVFILIGVSINVFIFLQISHHDIGILNLYNKDHIGLSPLDSIFNIIVGLLIIYKAITQEIEKTFNRRYNQKFLNCLNNFLAKNGRNPLLLIILSIPVFFIITLILTLFGQETNSIVKVFTETATWRFSQHSFPHPIPDTSSGGHYLCTVAAVGNPKLVKPLRLGKRHGKIIVVNRQLLIANAFEELIQDFSPKLHFIIRTNYDKYGFNISKKINSIFWSNIVYLLMKPLEWFFLLTLYSFCPKPEEKINAQYTD